MKPPPPGPATNGMVTPSALAVATAASIALPPCFSTSMPAWLASVSIEATAPPVPTAAGSWAAPAGSWAAPAGSWAAPARPQEAQEGNVRSTMASADTTEITGKRRMNTLRPA
jgi:hypothetical protein